MCPEQSAYGRLETPELIHACRQRASAISVGFPARALGCRGRGVISEGLPERVNKDLGS